MTTSPLLKHCLHTQSVGRARTHCDVFVLNKEALDQVLDSYPGIKQKITSRARNENRRALRMNQVVRDLQDERRAPPQDSDVTGMLRVRTSTLQQYILTTR